MGPFRMELGVTAVKDRMRKRAALCTISSNK